MSKKSIRFVDSLNLNTQKGYATTVRKYESYHHMDIDSLVNEALEEQTNNVPPHLLKVIDRIESFQEYLISKDLCHSSILLEVGRIKKIYTTNRVTLPYITPLKPTEGKKREYIEYSDILTHQEIRNALTHMSPSMQARTLVQAQAGLSNEECEHLHLTTFLEETYRYHQSNNKVNALKWLADKDNPIIWITKLIRQKTHKPYYAIIGAEAVNSIARAKLYELGLPSNNGVIPEKLLTNSKRGFQNSLKRINNQLGYGKVADEVKLRPHMLRKFHATNIGGSVLSYEENSIISNAEIDEMQGRGKTSVQDTYIKTNPIRQKVLYAKVMNNVCLFNKYDYRIINDDVILTRVDPSIQIKKLDDEVKQLTKIIKNKKKASDKVDALRNELGDEVFKELISEILNTS